jgi:hypothetical protein
VTPPSADDDRSPGRREVSGNDMLLVACADACVWPSVDDVPSPNRVRS